jgi:hypothetical protein
VLEFAQDEVARLPVQGFVKVGLKAAPAFYFGRTLAGKLVG